MNEIRHHIAARWPINDWFLALAWRVRTPARAVSLSDWLGGANGQFVACEKPNLLLCLLSTEVPLCLDSCWETATSRRIGDNLRDSGESISLVCSSGRGANQRHYRSNRSCANAKQSDLCLVLMSLRSRHILTKGLWSHSGMRLSRRMFFLVASLIAKIPIAKQA